MQLPQESGRTIRTFLRKLTETSTLRRSCCPRHGAATQLQLTSRPLESASALRRTQRLPSVHRTGTPRWPPPCRLGSPPCSRSQMHHVQSPRRQERANETARFDCHAGALHPRLNGVYETSRELYSRPDRETVLQCLAATIYEQLHPRLYTYTSWGALHRNCRSHTNFLPLPGESCSRQGHTAFRSAAAHVVPSSLYCAYVLREVSCCVQADEV